MKNSIEIYAEGSVQHIADAAKELLNKMKKPPLNKECFDNLVEEYNYCETNVKQIVKDENSAEYGVIVRTLREIREKLKKEKEALIPESNLLQLENVHIDLLTERYIKEYHLEQIGATSLYRNLEDNSIICFESPVPFAFLKISNVLKSVVPCWNNLEEMPEKVKIVLPLSKGANVHAKNITGDHWISVVIELDGLNHEVIANAREKTEELREKDKGKDIEKKKYFNGRGKVLDRYVKNFNNDPLDDFAQDEAGNVLRDGNGNAILKPRETDENIEKKEKDFLDFSNLYQNVTIVAMDSARRGNPLSETQEAFIKKIFLAGVVDEHNCQFEYPRTMAQTGQECGDCTVVNGVIRAICGKNPKLPNRTSIRIYHAAGFTVPTCLYKKPDFSHAEGVNQFLKDISAMIQIMPVGKNKDPKDKFVKQINGLIENKDRHFPLKLQSFFLALQKLLKAVKDNRNFMGIGNRFEDELIDFCKEILFIDYKEIRDKTFEAGFEDSVNQLIDNYKNNQDKIEERTFSIKDLRYNLEHLVNDDIPGPAEKEGDLKAGGQALRDWNSDLFLNAFIGDKTIAEIKGQADFQGCDSYTFVNVKPGDNAPENQLFLYEEGGFFNAYFNGKHKVLTQEAWNKIQNVNVIVGENQDTLCKVTAICGAFHFSNVKELSDFFEAHLFDKIKDKGQKTKLADEALRHFHQGGIPFATSQLILKAIKEEKTVRNLSPDDFSVNEPTTIIVFTPVENGVSIKEVDLFTKISEKDKLVEIGEFGYHLKATTEKTFTMSDANNQLTVEITNFSVDCALKHPVLSLFEKSEVTTDDKFIKIHLDDCDNDNDNDNDKNNQNGETDSKNADSKNVHKNQKIESENKQGNADLNISDFVEILELSEMTEDEADKKMGFLKAITQEKTDSGEFTGYGALLMLANSKLNSSSTGDGKKETLNGIINRVNALALDTRINYSVFKHDALELFDFLNDKETRQSVGRFGFGKTATERALDLFRETYKENMGKFFPDVLKKPKESNNRFSFLASIGNHVSNYGQVKGNGGKPKISNMSENLKDFYKNSPLNILEEKRDNLEFAKGLLENKKDPSLQARYNPIVQEYDYISALILEKKKEEKSEDSGSDFTF